MDPVVKGQKFMEFKVSKDPVSGVHLSGKTQVPL